MRKLECALAARCADGTKTIETMAADHARSWPWAGAPATGDVQEN